MFSRNQTPTTQAPTTSHARARTLAVRVLAIGALASSLVAAMPGTSQAWSVADARSGHGRVSLPRILANDTVIMSSVTRYGYDGRIIVVPQAITSLTIESAANPIAYRSPRTTGAQDVIAVYVLERWNGSAWATFSSTRVSGRIPAGASGVRLPRVGFTPGGNTGYYRAHWVFAWKVAGRVTNLGSLIVMADRASDFGCSSPLRPCEVGPGYLHVGRLYQLGGGW